MSNSGKSFEQLVARIQAKIDPSASVAHNVFIVDRLGHRRQFDVVIRGNFAGQPILGVIECKDLNKKVGTPEIDSFHTKAQDAHANFMIIASRSGFSDPALEKARHYGIRLVSLLDPDILKQAFPIGDWWTARVFRWSRITIQARLASQPEAPIQVEPERLFIGKGRVIDWFQNHLLKIGHNDKTVGWVVNFQIQFERPVELSILGGATNSCTAIDFHAERECREYERFVPISAEALVDWHTHSTTIPAGTTISTIPVPADLHSWPVRDRTKDRVSSFLPIEIEAHDHQFTHSGTAPDLEAM